MREFRSFQSQNIDKYWIKKTKKIDSCRISKMYTNITISFQLIYGTNELKSDYFMILFSEIKNVLQIHKLPHCDGTEIWWSHINFVEINTV